MVQIREVTNRALRTAFIDYPYALYRNDPTWVPPLRMGQFELLDPKKNAYWQHADGRLFLAVEGDQIVGRIALIDDHLHNNIHGENIAFFGFFEAATETAARELYRTVEEHARALGRSGIRGPQNPSLNDGSGFQLTGFKHKPYVMMPQSPAHYLTWAEYAGYEKVKDLHAYHIDNTAGPSERIARIAERIRKRHNVVVREANLRQLDEEIARLKVIHDAAWEQNWGNVPFTDAEMKQLGQELKLIIRKEGALFLEDNGVPVGVAIAVPDINQVFARFNGRLFPTGIFHLLRQRKIITRMRLVMLGVLPEYRNRGYDLLLINDLMHNVAKIGITEGECGWTLEDNDAINKAIVAAGGELYKTYRLYQKAL